MVFERERERERERDLTGRFSSTLTLYHRTLCSSYIICFNINMLLRVDTDMDVTYKQYIVYEEPTCDVFSVMYVL